MPLEKEELKKLFTTGKKPTGAHFSALIDGVQGPKGEPGIHGINGNDGLGYEEVSEEFKKVTEQLAQTANKEEVRIRTDIQPINVREMDTETKALFSGGAVAVVGLDAIGRENIKRKSVTEDKLSFVPLAGVKGKNLFNKKTTIVDRLINTTTGVVTNFAGVSVSDYIEVLPNIDYSLKNGRGLAFYDSNKVFILYSRLNTGTIHAPANAMFLLLDFSNSQLNILQFEKGTASTSYEPYMNFLDPDTLPQDSIDESKIKYFSISKLKEYEIGKNLFDNQADGMVSGYFISSAGTLVSSATNNASDFIEVNSGETYNLRYPANLAFFNSDKVYVVGRTSNDSPTFVVPENAKYIRISVTNDLLYDQQLEKGESFSKYEPFGFKLNRLMSGSSGKSREIIYTLKDAWISWENGGKFPVGFLGDSTTDGNQSTGFTGHLNADDASGGIGMADYHAPNAYPKVLQDLIQLETGNPNARIYNMGYSGTQHQWAKPRLDDLIGHAYSDIKMVGLVYGINDRGDATTAQFEEDFRTDYEEFINYFYDKGIQPFVVTTQATVEPDTLAEYQGTGNFPLRTSEAVNSVANRVKLEFAKKYNLEVIDMNGFGELFMTYSKLPLTNIIPDRLHFTDAGHKAEAEFIFSHFCPRVIELKNKTILSFTSQKMKSKVASDKVTLLPSVIDEFKVKAEYTKNESLDTLILDLWVLNKSKGAFNLKSFVTQVGATYVKLNGVSTLLTNTEQVISPSLDIGLHHIQAFTGKSNAVNFIGFKMDEI